MDKELFRKIAIVAVGGTAMTLVNAKPSTIDIDFTIPGENYDEFERAKRIVQPGFRVDVFRDGAVLVTNLFDDHLEKSKPIATNLKNIDLGALDPVDIIITKIARLDGRDWQDIELCMTNFRITQKQIEQDIAETFSDLFGVKGCAKSTIQHVIDAAATAMEPESRRIKAEMDARTTPVNIDETPYPVQDQTCQVWIASDPQSTVVVVAGSRGTAVIDEHFPYYQRPVTTDGLASYNVLEVRQRCWSHLFRDSDSYVRSVGKRTVVSQTDCRDAEALHSRLQQLFHGAKLMGTATASQCGVLKERLLEIAASYPRGLANKLASASNHLFTFLLHESMEPTNNSVEREMRYPVIHRKVRGQIGSTGKMARFGMLLTCILTWRKRKLNFYQEMDRILLAHV